MQFEAANPDFETAVRQSFGRQTFMQTLGASMLIVKPGRVEIAYGRKANLLQQHGFLHAGVAATCVDSACGYAALSLASESCEVLTSEFKVHFLRPSDGDEFLATGLVLKPGRLLTICEGDVTDRRSGLMIAKMTATMVVRRI